MSEMKTVFRWSWVWDFEKEEQWLNEMALNGWVLNGVSFAVYRFVRCEPGEYTVRLELHSSDGEYLNLMRETGAEYIGRVVGWMYFRRRSELGAFDIFSDIDSRIRHLESIAKMLAGVGAANLLLGIANSIHGMGVINLLCGCLLMYALGRIQGKADELKKERSLHE